MMKRLINNLNNYLSFLILYCFILILALIPYYFDGTIVLGGEGNYWLDFSKYLSSFGYSWLNSSIGMPATSLNGSMLNIYILTFLQKIFSTQTVNFILIFSIYFLPFMSMFLVCKELRTSPFISFIIALFYIVNPFTLYYLWCLNQWNTMVLAVIPLFFWIISRYYHNDFKLFLYFGLVSFAFAFANANPPLMVIIQISILLSTFVVSYYHNKRIDFIQFVRRYLILLVAFILFNLWWIMHWFVVLEFAKKIYTVDSALNWVDMISKGGGAIIFKALTFTVLIPRDPSYNFYSGLYNLIVSKFVVLIPAFIVTFCLFYHKIRTDKHVKNLMLYLLSFWLILIFLIKGTSFPFGEIYRFMFTHIPFFYIFKTPTEKFAVLYIFIFTILLTFLMESLRGTKYYKWTVGLFLFYLLFCSLPIITGNIIPDYKFGENTHVSRRYVDKLEYENFRKKVNKVNIDYKILSLPGSKNYQVCMANYDNKYYTGLDPVLYNTNKSFISATNGPQLLFDNISFKNYKKLLGLYNIKTIMLNENLVPWFGFRQKEGILELKKIFQFNKAADFGKIELFEISDEYFLPHIYSATIPILINGGTDKMFRAVTSDNFTLGTSALFLSKDLDQEHIELVKVYGNTLLSIGESAPKIIFQKINPTKYKVHVDASQPFFLVFSESYHPQWKAYIEDKSFKFNEIIASYKNIKEAKHEIKITPGDISYLFARPISEDNHFLVNGYANAWYIEPNEIDEAGDGEFTITIYFWPQSLFYIGLVVSATTFLGCIGYLNYTWRRKKKH